MAISQDVFVQKELPKQRFDFIKLDIEGYEQRLLNDAASRKILCKAICIFTELHDNLEIPGLMQTELAWHNFQSEGCPPGRRFVAGPHTGEYFTACREDLMNAATADMRA